MTNSPTTYSQGRRNVQIKQVVDNVTGWRQTRRKLELRKKEAVLS